MCSFWEFGFEANLKGSQEEVKKNWLTSWANASGDFVDDDVLAPSCYMIGLIRLPVSEEANTVSGNCLVDRVASLGRFVGEAG